MTAAETRTWSLNEPVRDDYLVFGRPQLLDAEIDEMMATLRSGWIGTGPKVARFQEAFRSYTGAGHAVAVSSCTAALHLAMIAIGIEPGDEVIVPSMTFAATANVVVHAGGRPVLADVRRDTMCLDPDDTARRITSRTRAIIPVHFAGRCCEMNALMELARHHDLKVIEDCAHAIETLDGERHAGTIGDIGAFSFYVTKNVVTGEGGMVTTANQQWAGRIRTLALHGMSADAWKRFSDQGFKQYEIVEAGFKYNLTDMQAALGIHQLARVEENLLRRRAIWARYDAAFADLPVFLPAPEQAGTRHARHLYTPLLDIERLRADRDEVQMALHRQRIGTGVHYRAVHLNPFYRDKYGYARGDLPAAEWISDRTLSLPMSPALSDQDVDDVIFATRRTLEHFAK
ncbi:MAG: DegT/DnrJ/EryC1/StrS family aminotransferase [Gemmatimonadaceae bacterium]|nr:DegT/DnrJ/EryC1/StrS family aminotransferase [Gemmatimonadaceae bacterium]